MNIDVSLCELCGEPMPNGEEMFNYHGYSGPCPKPPLPRPKDVKEKMLEALNAVAIWLTPNKDASVHLSIETCNLILAAIHSAKAECNGKGVRP